jgi:hypothetical protein
LARISWVSPEQIGQRQVLMAESIRHGPGSASPEFRLHESRHRVSGADGRTAYAVTLSGSFSGSRHRVSGADGRTAYAVTLSGSSSGSRHRVSDADPTKPPGGGGSVCLLRPPGVSSRGRWPRGATRPTRSNSPSSTSSRSRRTGTSRCRSSGSTRSRRRPDRPRRTETQGPWRPRAETQTWEISLGNV